MAISSSSRQNQPEPDNEPCVENAQPARRSSAPAHIKRPCRLFFHGYYSCWHPASSFARDAAQVISIRARSGQHAGCTFGRCAAVLINWRSSPSVIFSRHRTVGRPTGPGTFGARAAGSVTRYSNNRSSVSSGENRSILVNMRDRAARTEAPVIHAESRVAVGGGDFPRRSKVGMPPVFTLRAAAGPSSGVVVSPNQPVIASVANGSRRRRDARPARSPSPIRWRALESRINKMFVSALLKKRPLFNENKRRGTGQCSGRRRTHQTMQLSPYFADTTAINEAAAEYSEQCRHITEKIMKR